MTTLQDEQAPRDNAVCNAMLDSTPESWQTIVLTLERCQDAQVGELLHSLQSPEGHPPVAPSDSLLAATFELDALFARYGKRFTRATYRVDARATPMKFEAEFSYDQPRRHPFK